MNIFVFIFVGAVNLSLIGAQKQGENPSYASPEPTNTGPEQPPTHEKLVQGQRTMDRDQNDVLNIGNGQGRHNFVIVNENPRRPGDDGIGNRFGSEYPSPDNYPNRRPTNNPNSRRTTNINNIGNGVGNRNWVVIQDNPDGGRTVSTLPQNNFDPRDNHPNGNYPNSNYPDGNNPNGNYPNDNYPNGNHPNNNRRYNNPGVDYRTPDTYTSIGHGSDNHNTVIINGRPVVNSRSGSNTRQGEQRPRYNAVYIDGYNIYDDGTLRVLPIARKH